MCLANTHLVCTYYNRSACLIFADQNVVDELDIYALVINDSGRKGAIITPYSWSEGELSAFRLRKGIQSLLIPGTKYSVSHFED